MAPKKPVKKKAVKKKILQFIPKEGSKRTAADGAVLEEGKFGKLNYKVFKRGVIHIFNNTKTLLFKKDCELFETEIDKMNLNNLKDEDVEKMVGSGDNDNLVFTCVKGDLIMSLEKREYSMLTKLKSILKMGAKKK